VLGPADVLRAVVDVDLLELVAVGQGSAGYVHVLLGVLVHPEDQRLAGVVQSAGNLQYYIGGTSGLVFGEVPWVILNTPCACRCAGAANRDRRAACRARRRWATGGVLCCTYSTAD